MNFQIVDVYISSKCEHAIVVIPTWQNYYE
jgi:hypothetical protein